ncbi:hypothetical protein AAF712_007776 [Marasmius tenuissimus]|uniref:Uncharacterized protein n=1 Tax=Marasmius tenuissimus TaxID=585030 RepID=A0ABR2ZUA8_9AGAR
MVKHVQAQEIPNRARNLAAAISMSSVSASLSTKTLDSDARGYEDAIVAAVPRPNIVPVLSSALPASTSSWG